MPCTYTVSLWTLATLAFIASGIPFPTFITWYPSLTLSHSLQSRSDALMTALLEESYLAIHIHIVAGVRSDLLLIIIQCLELSLGVARQTLSTMILALGQFTVSS